MKKAYLLVYSDSLGSRNAVKECLSAIESVITWRYDMPNCFYIISERTAAEIYIEIKGYLGNGRFLITEISDNRQGRLTRDSWNFIKFKKKSS